MIFSKTRLQKIAIIVLLVISGILLITSFGFTESGWKDLLYSGSKTNGNNNFFGQCLYYNSVVFPGQRQEAASFYYQIWDDIQAANNMIFYVAIWAFVFIAIAFICGNFSRRRFYISNLVSGLLYSVVTIILSIVSMAKIAVVGADFAKAEPDFEVYYQRALEEAVIYHQDASTISKIETHNLGNYYFLLVVMILISIAFAVVTILKFKKTYPGKQNKVEKEESAEIESADVNEKDELVEAK